MNATGPTATVTARVWWKQTTALLVCGTLLFLPLILFVANSGSYLQTGHESLAYRYFFPYRLASGEESRLWLPQGWATGVLQRIILGLQGLFIPPESQLRQSMEIFGGLTTAVQSGLGLLLLVIAFRDRSLHPIQKTAIALALLIPLFCSHAGNYYWMLPDYYQLNIVLLAALVYCFTKAEGIANSRSWLKGVVLLGLYLGVVVANKVSLALPCLIAIVPIVLGTITWNRVSSVLVACFVGALVGLTSTILLVYVPHWSLIGAAITPWLAYVRAPGSEMPLSMAFVETYVIPNNYHVMAALYAVTWLSVLTLLWASLGWRSKAFHRSVALTLLGLIAPLPLLAKQSGTTIFEVFLTLTAITMAQVCLLPTLRQGVRAGWVLGRVAAAGVVVSCAVITGQASAWTDMASVAARSRARAEFVWKLSESIHAVGAPVIVVTPDNDHIFVSPEEALLRGFADFPSWRISTGQLGIDRFYPGGLSFRTLSDAVDHPGAPYPLDSVIMWFDMLHPAYRLLTTQYPALAEAASRPGVACRKWADPDNPYRVAVVCVPATNGQTPVGPTQ